jgi:ABC-type glutathione transport system ATPase component
MNNIIEVNNLSYTVRIKNSTGSSSEKLILDNISFTLQREKVLGIAGESGSGKTTLAKVLAQILQPTSGNISLNVSDDWKNRKTKPVQILFQNNGEILNPLREINDVINEAIKIRFGNEEYESNKKKILYSVNLPENLWNRKGYELSGGEQQRAALARILSVQPEVLILDEPFSAQDPTSQLNFLNLFKSINKEYKITMICISHNLKVLRLLCDEVIVMYKGKIVEMGEAKNIFETPQHPYTKFLLRAEDYSLSYDEIQNELESLKE